MFLRGVDRSTLFKMFQHALYFLLLLLPRCNSLDVRFDPPNATVIPFGSSITVEAPGSSHLCYSQSSILPFCKTNASQGLGCSFGSTTVLGHSATLTTTAATTARITAVGCGSTNVTSKLSTHVYFISQLQAGHLSFSPSPAQGNVKEGNVITISSAKASYLCVTEDGTDPTCTAKEVGKTCGNGKTYLGDSVQLIIAKHSNSFRGRGCMNELTAASSVVRAEYVLGPIASIATFVIHGDSVSNSNVTSTSTTPTVVRKGATITATSAKSVIVCMKSWIFDSNAVVPLPPTCNAANGTTCGIGSSPNPIVLTNTASTTVISAIGCTLESEAGTHSIPIQNFFQVGTIVEQITALPALKGKVQAATQILLSSKNADAICWSTDVGRDSSSSSLCLTNGTGCIHPLNAYHASNSITVTGNNAPLTITVEGCTSMFAMGINAKKTIGPFEIGETASLPRLTSTEEEAAAANSAADVPPTTIKAGDVVKMTSKNSLLVCWTSVVVSVFIEGEEATTHTTEVAALAPPSCESTGTVCQHGMASDRTLPTLTTGYTDARTLILKAVGCQETTLGTGGGTHSPVLTKTYTIVPQLAAPVLDPKTLTMFKNSQGQIKITGDKATGGACYVTHNTGPTAVPVAVRTKCPVQPPECHDNPTAAKKCAIGTHLDLSAGTTIPVTEDFIVCVQICSKTATAGLHSALTIGEYNVLKGSKVQRAVLEDIYEKMNGKTGGWLYKWDLDSYYCDLNGVECDACPASVGGAVVKGGGTCPERHNIQTLNLGYVGLTGRLADLSALVHLKELALPGNAITGSLPVLTSLTKLTSLKLFYNSIAGSIPEHFIGGTALVELDLDHNQLTGSLPLSICNLVNLKSLDLSHNQLTGEIPECLGTLTQLTKLDLSNNKFEGGVPESFAQLLKLKKLNLDSNPSLDVTLSDAVCDRTKQCMPPMDEDFAVARGGGGWWAVVVVVWAVVVLTYA